MDCLFSELTTLQYQNKAMRQELEAFRNGERYKKLQANHHKVVTGYIKEISRLKKNWQRPMPTRPGSGTSGLRNATRTGKSTRNFFAWVEDFSMPTTNNLSGRALHGVKTKMKVPGQFASAGTADNYAAIRTYIETCRRNGINEMEALKRLCRGCPYTVEEYSLKHPSHKSMKPI